MRTFLSLLLAALLSSINSATVLQAPTPVPSAQSGQAAPSSPNTCNKSKDRPLPSFLILGTVYDEKALSLPGVQVRIRRSGEKKFRWETYTNSRGEFAVRVPPGYDYEVLSHMKNYQDQNQGVDAKVEVQQRLSIKLIPRDQAKNGAKP
jgi:hypothetical protein